MLDTHRHMALVGPLAAGTLTWLLGAQQDGGKGPVLSASCVRHSVVSSHTWSHPPSALEAELGWAARGVSASQALCTAS